MELTEILTPDRVRVPLESQDKTGVITELIDLQTWKDIGNRKDGRPVTIP